MTNDALVLFAMLLAGSSLAWFLGRGRPQDKVATGLGLAIGATLGFAINDSALFLLALILFAPLLIWRTRLRRHTVD